MMNLQSTICIGMAVVIAGVAKRNTVGRLREAFRLLRSGLAFGGSSPASFQFRHSVLHQQALIPERKDDHGLVDGELGVWNKLRLTETVCLALNLPPAFESISAEVALMLGRN